MFLYLCLFFFFFQAEDGIRDGRVTGVQTCALPISTNLPYAANTVPISAQAQALLQQYPMPNVSNVPGINYEASGLTNQHFDALQSRLSKYKNRNQFFGNFDYQHQASQNDANIFGYRNGSNSQGIDAAVSWQHVYRPGGLGYLTTNFKYEFNRLASSQNPFFAFRTNVSGEIGRAHV